MASIQKIFIVLTILCCVLSNVYCEDMDTTSDTNVAEGRTFGHHFLKRISFAIIPTAFVVGVITTLLAALTVVSLKGLGVGTILLILALGQLLARSIPQPLASYAAPPPLPFVYSHHSRATPELTNPVWLEKDWS